MKRGIRASGTPEPLISHEGMTRYEVRQISNVRIHKGQSELWVEWKGSLRSVSKLLGSSGHLNGGCSRVNQGIRCETIDV